MYGHFETSFLVEDDRPAPCPLGLGCKKGDSGGLTTARLAKNQRVAIGRFRLRIAGFVEAEPVQ